MGILNKLLTNSGDARRTFQNKSNGRWIIGCAHD